MEDLIKKYNISDGFYNRYFRQNAEFRYGVEMLQFLYFKKGKFLNPQKKNFYIDEYTKEEIDNFYNKKQINLPQLSFCITSKCSLKCRDCGSLIPPFNKTCHIDMQLDEFSENLDKVTSATNKIRRFVLLGGEPLLNKNLATFVELACKKENIDVVEVITNGTILPNEELLKTMHDNNKKTYLYISNYSATPDVKPLLKHEQIKALLKEHDIKLQMVDVMGWLQEFGFKKEKSDRLSTIEKYKKCHCSHCSQIFNNKMYVCSKASSAIELKMIDVDDYIDFKNSKDIKKDLIEFFDKDYLKACEYCVLSDVHIKPALQE